MGASSTRWWVVLLALVIGPLVPERGNAEEEPEPKLRASAAWRDPAQLEKHLRAACEAVEGVCGAKFVKRPGVRVATAEEMQALLEKELATLAAMKGQDVSRSAAGFARFVMGKYDAAAHVIHVLPGNAEQLALALKAEAPPGDDDLRVLLAHEATHALDWERFGWDEIYRSRPTLDALQAFNAVSEGHAQWVAEQVAARWTLTGAFDRLTHGIIGVPPGLPEAQRLMVEAMVAQTTFAYTRGLEFVRAIEKARGANGLEATLRAPPPGTRDIEQPERWLATLDGTATRDEDPDLDAALADLRTLVGDPAWETLTMRLLEAVLRSQIAKVVPADRPTFLRGYQDGRVFTGSVPGEDVLTSGLVLLFRTPEDALHFAATERRTVDRDGQEAPPGVVILSTTLTEGAGPDGALPGISVVRQISVVGKLVQLQQQVGVVGRTVIELLIVGVPDLDRAAQDAVVGRAALRLRDPKAAASAPPLIPKPFRRTSTRRLVARVVGPDGQPIPRFKLEVHGEHTSFDLEGKDGEAQEALPLEGEFTVSVWGFTDGEGASLPLAPTGRVAVPADGSPLEIRLEPGLEIHGLVVDASGQPIGGLQVVARPVEVVGAVSHHSGNDHARGATSVDGKFALRGVNDGEYRLFLLREGKPASAEIPRVRGGARDARLVLRPVQRVTVTVQDADGQPVAGAALRVSGVGRSEYFAHAETDEAGQATLDGMAPEGKYWLFVEPGPSHPTVGRVNVFGWKPTEAPFRLPRGRVLRGRVVDLAGKGVRATVTLRTSRGSSDSVESDEGGRFSIPSVPVGPAYLAPQAARAAGGAPSASDKPLWVKVPADQDEVTLVLGAPPGPDANVDDE